MGRPRKPPADKRSVRVVLHLTPAEKKQLDRMAAAARVPTTVFARLRVVG